MKIKRWGFPFLDFDEKFGCEFWDGICDMLLLGSGLL